MHLVNLTEMKIVRENTVTNVGQEIGKLDEMNKLLKMYNLPKLNQEETENLIRPITSKENWQSNTSQQRKALD